MSTQSTDSRAGWRRVVRVAACVCVVGLGAAAVAAAKGDVDVVLRVEAPDSATAPPEGVFELASYPIAVRFEDARAVDDRGFLGLAADGSHVRTTSDVATYAEEALLRSFRRWGLAIEASAERRLTVRLLEFSVDGDPKKVGSRNAAKVKAEFLLADKAGQMLWQGKTMSESSRLGRKRGDAGIQKVLNDALHEVYAALFDSAKLRRAWVTGSVPAD